MPSMQRKGMSIRTTILSYRFWATAVLGGGDDGDGDGTWQCPSARYTLVRVTVGCR